VFVDGRIAAALERRRVEQPAWARVRRQRPRGRAGPRPRGCLIKGPARKGTFRLAFRLGDAEPTLEEVVTVPNDPDSEESKFWYWTYLSEQHRANVDRARKKSKKTPSP
jgi:hypothetical protein